MTDAPLVLAVPSKGRLQENANAFFARAALEQGLRWTQHEIDWAHWVIDGLDKRRG